MVQATQIILGQCSKPPLHLISEVCQAVCMEACVLAFTRSLDLRKEGMLQALGV